MYILQKLLSKKEIPCFFLIFEFETISGEQIKLPISIDENFEADNTEVIILNKYLKLELYEY